MYFVGSCGKVVCMPLATLMAGFQFRFHLSVIMETESGLVGSISPLPSLLTPKPTICRGSSCSTA